MYRPLKLAALCAALAMAAAPAFAALKLKVSDGTPGGTITVTDQAPGDANATPGIVGYTGPIGSQWIVTVSSGASKPELGSAAQPRMDLNSFNFSSDSGGTIYVELTDTDFTGTGPATVALGGVTAGTLHLKTFMDPANAEFAQTTLIADQGPLFGGAFADNAVSSVTASGPYSITFALTVTHNGAGSTGMDGDLSVRPPITATCPPDVTVKCGASLDPAQNPALGQPTYNGPQTCQPVTMSHADSVTATAPCSQTILRTWTVVDACNNTNTCTQTITVIEDVNPVLTVPGDATAECDSIPALGTASATDNCDTNVTVEYLGETRLDGQNPLCAYTLVRTWKATDSCGNAVTNRQNILVRDTTEPILTVPAPITIECGAPIPAGSASATDNCSSAPVTFLGATTNGIGCTLEIIRVWKAEDACGNATTNRQVITVVDTTKPVLTVSGNATIECGAALPSGSASATDNCGQPTVTFLGTVTNGTGCTYEVIRTWKAEDACGNAVTNRQIITVSDTTKPVLTVPANVTIDCGTPLPSTTAAATDNCGTPVVTYLGTTTNGSGCNFTVSRTWKAADACGNAVTNKQTVTVRDTTAPVITSVPTGGDIGCTTLPTDASIKSQVTATDACGTVTINVSHVDNATACATNRVFSITATDGCNTSAVRTVTYTANCGGTEVCTTFNFNGSTSTYGTKGNIRTFTTNGVSVKVSAFSRARADGVWATAYLGQYPGGLGVTDGSEGDGSGNAHTVDNVDRDNYVLFEFSQPVVINRAFLGYVVNDSDVSLWVGSFADPFNNHLTLSDSVLGSFGLSEQNLAYDAATRWADLNAGEVSGNAIILAADVLDATPEDMFKIQLVEFCTRGTCETNPPPPATGSICGTVLRDCDADASLYGESGLGGWTVTLKNSTTSAVIATKTTDASGNYCFTNVAAGSYCVVVSPMANYTQTVDPDSTKDNKTCFSFTAGENKTGVNFGYTGTQPGVYLKVTGPSTAKCGDTITYTFCVTNTGNTCVYGGLRVESPLLGGQIFHQTPVNPGQGYCFTKTYVVKTTDAGTLTLTATAIGDPPGALANVTMNASVATTVTCTPPPSQGCTLTIGYYKNHPEAIAPLPIYLGTQGGAKTLIVSSQQIGVNVLGQKTYGTSANGITKLYAQLLAAKLNILSGANNSAVASAITSADAFLATHNHTDWTLLTSAEQTSVLAWHTALDNYNNGLTGPGHCGDKEVCRALRLTAVCGSAKVTLKWTKSQEATSYRIDRATTPGGPYTTIKSGVTGTNYVDTTCANGTAYYYVVAAIKSGVETTLSDEVACIPAAALPSPWKCKDIGACTEKGGSHLASGVFSIIGSGCDIWNSADAYQMTYQTGNGDCSVVARVNSVGNTDPWAKAGVMIRETLTAGSKHAFMCLTPGNGAAFQCRTSTGGSSQNANTTGIAAPSWVKITRVGNVFTGYTSPNGTTWTKVGQQTITMTSTVYIGLGVTSHNDGVLCPAKFQNVTATP